MTQQRVTYLSHYHYGDVVRVNGNKGWVSAVTFTCDDTGPVVLYEIVTDRCTVKNVRRESLSEPPKLSLVKG